MPKNFEPAIKERAVRMVLEQLPEYASLSQACAAVGASLGEGKETLRTGVRKAQIDAGQREGLTTAEDEEIKRLKAENRRLREDVAILKAATTFFAGNSTPANADHGLHRPDEGLSRDGSVGDFHSTEG